MRLGPLNSVNPATGRTDPDPITEVCDRIYGHPAHEWFQSASYGKDKDGTVYVAVKVSKLTQDVWDCVPAESCGYPVRVEVED